MNTKELSKLTGFSLRQFQWWDETGRLSPKISGHRREYSPEQVRATRILAALYKKRIRGTALVKKLFKQALFVASKIDDSADGWILMVNGVVSFVETPELVTAIAETAEGPVFVARWKASEQAGQVAA